MPSNDTKWMENAIKVFRKQDDALCKLLSDVTKPAWTTRKHWYADRMINETDVNSR